MFRVPNLGPGYAARASRRTADAGQLGVGERRRTRCANTIGAMSMGCRQRAATAASRRVHPAPNHYWPDRHATTHHRFQRGVTMNYESITTGCIDVEALPWVDRKSGVSGKRVSVGVDL